MGIPLDKMRDYSAMVDYPPQIGGNIPAEKEIGKVGAPTKLFCLILKLNFIPYEANIAY